MKDCVVEKKKKKERLVSLHLAGVCPLSEHVQVVGSWGESGTTDSGVYRVPFAGYSQQQINISKGVVSFVDKDLLLGLGKHFQKDPRFQLPMEKKTLLALYWWSCVSSPFQCPLFLALQSPVKVQHWSRTSCPAPIQLSRTLSLCIKWNCAHNSHSWGRPLTSLGPLKMLH